MLHLPQLWATFKGQRAVFRGRETKFSNFVFSSFLRASSYRVVVCAPFRCLPVPVTICSRTVYKMFSEVLDSITGVLVMSLRLYLFFTHTITYVWL